MFLGFGTSTWPSTGRAGYSVSTGGRGVFRSELRLSSVVDPKTAADVPASRFGMVLTLYASCHDQVEAAVTVPVSYAKAAIEWGNSGSRHESPTRLKLWLVRTPDIAEPGNTAELLGVPLSQDHVAGAIAVPVRDRDVAGDHGTRSW